MEAVVAPEEMMLRQKVSAMAEPSGRAAMTRVAAESLTERMGELLIGGCVLHQIAFAVPEFQRG